MLLLSGSKKNTDLQTFIQSGGTIPFHSLALSLRVKDTYK